MCRQEETSALREPERVFVLSGPSGVGKNTIAVRLCERGETVRALTATSRGPRPGEQDGVDYHFVSPEQFQDWVREGRLLEHVRYCGHWYGTPASSLNGAVRSGRPVLLVIDVEGALRLKRQWPALNLIFVAPPSEEALRNRLRHRGDVTGDQLAGRMRRARREMDLAEQYDWVVVNDNLHRAVAEVAQIIEETTGGR